MTVGLGFVGAGIVAGPHSRAVGQVDGVRFVGVHDPDVDRAASVAHGLGGRTYRTLEDLLEDPAIDAVVVMTPNHAHVSVALECLSAGKHVLIEKPVAESFEDLTALRHSAEAVGKACMPAHNYIYHPAVIRAQRLVRTGAFGRVASLWILYNIFHSEELAHRYGGVLREVCVHHAYSLNFLVGRPTTVSAMATSLHYEELTCEDMVSLVCRCSSGALANLWCSFAASDPTADPWTVIYKVLGDKGGVTHSWSNAVFDDDRGPGYGFPDYLDGFSGELDFFINRAIARGEAPLSTLQDAADALALIEAAERSIRDQGRETGIAYRKV